jgi:hypothetical protein
VSPIEINMVMATKITLNNSLGIGSHTLSEIGVEVYNFFATKPTFENRNFTL